MDETWLKPELVTGSYVRHTLYRFEVRGKILRRERDMALVAWESPINSAKWEPMTYLAREDA